MGLDKPTLKTGLKNLATQLYNNSATMSPADAQEQWAEGLANLIDAYVKSADGVYQPGKLVAGGNAVTATGTPAIKLQ